jgi:hypothetical protein
VRWAYLRKVTIRSVDGDEADVSNNDPEGTVFGVPASKVGLMLKLHRNGRGANLVLEILMIVIGINVALWFESWFQDLQDADIEEQYLADLRDDLLTDIGNLDIVIEGGEAKSQRATRIIELMPSIADLSPEEQAQAIYTPSNYQFFSPSDFTYRSMQESGDFRLLRNGKIKKGILRLNRRHKDIAMLQKNYLQAMDDGYIPLMMNYFDLAAMTVSDPSLFQDQLFQNFFVYTRQDTDAMVALYRLARSQSQELVELIEEELTHGSAMPNSRRGVSQTE